jgi:hypothetical protein
MAIKLQAAQMVLRGGVGMRRRAGLLGVLEEQTVAVGGDPWMSLAHHGAAGFDRRVDGWAELVQDESGAGGMTVTGLLGGLLALRCSWRTDSRDFTSG